MSFNKFMHPRNIYKVPPDFKQVAIEYPEFRKHLYQDLSGKLKYNFKDPNALKVFSTTLLHRDFGLNIDIPGSHLVPTLPLRLNYILWIEDLLALNHIQSPVHGIDIGTGASCIYPLLGNKKNSWHMLALDTDKLSCKCAQKNVEQNGLENFISVRNTSLSPNCLEPFLDQNLSYFFTMCNPPFYASSNDIQASKPRASVPKQRLANVVTDRNSRHPPSNGHTGSEAELMAPGGEVAFVKKFVEANLHLGQIKIFTTMLGHKTSFTLIKQFLSQHPSVKKMSTTEFCQGNTMRWGIAWTALEGITLRDELPRKADGTSKSKPLVCVLEADSVQDVMCRIVTLCDGLKIIYKVLKKSTNSCKLSLTALENTWCNQRRLRRQKHKQEEVESLSSELRENDSQYPLVEDGNSVRDTTCESKGTNLMSGTSQHDQNNTNAAEMKEIKNTTREKASIEVNRTCDDKLNTNDAEIKDASSEPPRKKASKKIDKTWHDKLGTNSVECSDLLQSIFTKNSDHLKNRVPKNSLDICSQEGLTKNSSDIDIGSQEGLTKSCEILKNSVSKKRVENFYQDVSNENISFKAPLVVCNLLIEKLDSTKNKQTAIEMIWVSGTGSKDLPHQIMQYLKNNL